MASSIPAARTAIVASLQSFAASGQPLADVMVARTGLYAESEFDTITVGNPGDDVEREPMMYGMRAERFTLPVQIIAKAQTANIQEVEDRSWVIADLVEQHLQADETFGGALVTSHVEGVEDVDSGPSSVSQDTLEASVTLRLACEARIIVS